MLVLQGADDEVVPPAQAELIVAALRERGVPHAYLLFEGEGHGFRKAENIVRSLEAELSFYLQVLGLEPGDPLPTLEIEHLPFVTPQGRVVSGLRPGAGTIPAPWSPS